MRNTLLAARGGLALVLFAVGCSSTVEITDSVAPPRRLAVLPLVGNLEPDRKELVRRQLREQLRVRYLAVAENDYVDRVLCDQGWLNEIALFQNPEAISTQTMARLCESLGVDGVVICDELRWSYLNLPLYHRRTLSGHWRILNTQGEMYWTCEHASGASGGILLGAGQVIRTLREHSRVGSKGAFLQLATEYVDDIVSTLPEFPAGGIPETKKPIIEGVSLSPPRRIQGSVIEIVIRATPNSSVTFDLSDTLSNLPTREITPGVYRGYYQRVPWDGVLDSVTVQANIRGRFGRRGTPTAVTRRFSSHSGSTP